MIQSGILYTIDSTTGQATNKPLKGAWINFVQNDVIKARTQTHSETGAYSVDVPFGKYTVNLAVGNVTVTMRAGQLFELKSGDNANAFQNWLYSTTADVDDTLLNSFKQIANDISDSANRAESAATEAQQIQQQMQNNSIGDANGKWMKEGAGGLLGLTKDMTLISDTTTKITRTRNSILDVAVFPNDNYYNGVWTGYAPDRFSGLFIDAGQYRSFIVSQAQKKAYEVYTEAVTKKDKNNVLHVTTGTPKDTLLVGDLGLGNALRFNQTDNVTNLASHALGSSFRWCVNVVGRPDGSHNGNVIVTRENDNYGNLLYQDLKGNLFSNTVFGGVAKGWKKLYSENNTIKDVNGNLKGSSPTVELFNDHINFIGFGYQVPIFEKLAIGTYKISNTHGMAREGWTYQKPQGKDGNYFFKIRVQKLDDGCIVTVHDYYVADEEVEIIDEHGNHRKVKKQVEVLGMPRDIKDNERWINLRFHEQIYSLTNELPEINIPYRELWGVEPYIPPTLEQTEENIDLLDQRAF